MSGGREYERHGEPIRSEKRKEQEKTRRRSASPHVLETATRKLTCLNPESFHLTRYSLGRGSFQAGTSPAFLFLSVALAGKGLQAMILSTSSVHRSARRGERRTKRVSSSS